MRAPLLTPDRPTAARGRRHRGLGMVEVLVALSITAVLMLSVVQAVRASTEAFRTNQSQAMLSMRSRVVLMRLIDHVRANSESGPAHPTSQYLTSGTPMLQAADGTGGDSGIVVTEPQSDGGVVDTTYQWDSTTQQLNMTRATYNSAGAQLSSTTRALLHGVTAFNVSLWPAKNQRVLPTPSTYTLLTRATITMTVADTTTQFAATGSPMTVTLSGSAVPRQNNWTGTQLRYSIDTMLAQEAKYR